MSTATDNKKILKGGEFVISESDAQSVFTPEDLNEEQQMFGSALKDFIETKVHPHIARIDKGDHDLVVQLLEEIGEMGYLGSSIPEEYGGMDMDLNTETLISENMGQTHSFGVAFAAHTGIGSLPVLYYGTEEQKKKYLPGLANGKLKAAYCLTEPGAGSDALSAKTKAILTEDGKHYVITGTKMWITNSGFADMFIVFAKIDGDKFTGFIVDANTEGVRLGAEEDKMGIKGSSTRQVFFEGAKVPKENVLGEIGKGHKIAFNVLNIGRYKLCAMVLGGAKLGATTAIKYANERFQFNMPIASFGAIQHKLAEMAVKIYATESATYRASGLINDKIEALMATGMQKYEALKNTVLSALF
jgi:alkylation response protein AidB-like acyl-CoA dehydrogenase